MRFLAGLVTIVFISACSEPGIDLALGTLERDRIILKATASEIILDQPVAEGTLVAAGTLLVQLDDRRQQALVAIARAELAQTEFQLEELRNGARAEDIAAASARVAGARATLVEARANYQRAVKLVEQKLAAKAQLDSTLAARDAAEANLESAQEELLRLTNGTRKEQLDQAEAAVQAAAARLALTVHDLGELTVTATRDAYLDSLPWNVGERVDTGATLALLLADGQPYARVYVPEPRRTSLTIGERKQVRVDGVPDAFWGKLRWIASDPAFTPYFALNAGDRARLVYLAEFDIENGDKLPTGIPVQVQLVND